MRRALQFGAVILVNAALQALIAWVDQPTPSIGLAVVSGIILVTASWLVWWIAGGARGTGWALFALVLAAGVVTAAAGLLFPPAVPVVVAAGCAVLGSGGVRATGRTFRDHPVRGILLALLTIVFVVVTWALTALSGLLIGGVANSVLVWLWVGVFGALFAVGWTRLGGAAKS